MSELTLVTPLQLRRARFWPCLFSWNKESTGLRRCAHPSLWTMFQVSWILEYLVRQPQSISKSTQISSLSLSFWEWTTLASWGLKGGQEMTLYRRGCGWSSDVYMIVWRKSREWKVKGVGHKSSEELWGVRILNLNLAFPDTLEEYLSRLNYRIYLVDCSFGSQLLNVWVYSMWAPMCALPPDAENDEIRLCTCFRLWVRSKGHQEMGTTKISLFVCVCSSSEIEVLEICGGRENGPPSPLPAILMGKLHLWSSSGQQELPCQTLWRALARDSCCSDPPGSSSLFFLQTSQRFYELLTQQPFIFF